jgi:hypothetical protein
MQDYEIGFHVVSREEARKHGRFDDRVSVVEFLRCLRAERDLPLDVTVSGLDEFLRAADDTDAAVRFVNGVLADGANHLTRSQPVIQFVVDDIEHWDDHPVLPLNEGRARLDRVFGGLEQEGAKWYVSKLNVTS